MKDDVFTYCGFVKQPKGVIHTIAVTSDNSKLLEALIADIEEYLNNDTNTTEVTLNDCPKPIKAINILVYDNNTIDIYCFSRVNIIHVDCESHTRFDLLRGFSDAFHEICKHIKTDKVLYTNSIGEVFRESERESYVYYYNCINFSVCTLLLRNISPSGYSKSKHCSEIFKSKKSLFQYLADQEK